MFVSAEAEEDCSGAVSSALFKGPLSEVGGAVTAVVAMMSARRGSDD
jgi:hypothetical protein